jgi:hypothetical protein
MKKFCILIIFNSYLFACSDLACESNGPDNPCYAALCKSNGAPCYGYKCESNGEPCYGDECFANNAACYGNNCRSNRGIYPLDESTINQFNNVVFTKQQFEALPENERNELAKRLEKRKAQKRELANTQFTYTKMIF